jgi:RNase P subunit RPR2
MSRDTKTVWPSFTRKSMRMHLSTGLDPSPQNELCYIFTARIITARIRIHLIRNFRRRICPACIEGPFPDG